MIKQMNFSFYTTLSPEDAIAYLESNATSGLNNEQYGVRKREYGLNEVDADDISKIALLLRQMKSPFIYLLLFAGGVSFFLKNSTEGVVLLCIVALNTLFGFYQEYRASKTVQMLKHYVLDHIKIRRNGAEVQVVSTDIVPGDIVVLYPGDRVPADMRIIESYNGTVDESMITGESLAVVKTSEKLEAQATEFFSARNIVFAGTTVMTGKIIGVVFATGSNDALGLLTLRAASNVEHMSSFSRALGQFSRFVLYLVLISLLIICAAHILIKGMARVDIIELILFASALAVSVVPEALPLVMTFALSQGALRLAQRKTVVKRLSAIEDLGNVQILCTDKTGTLTENLLRVTDLYGNDPKAVALYALLAGDIGDPKNIAKGFDKALYNAMSEEEHLNFSRYHKIAEIPFDPSRLRTVALVKNDAMYEIILRGASEVVLTQCDSMTPEEREASFGWITAEGRKGNRVIAVAKKAVTVGSEKELALHDAHAEENLTFLGLVSFQDPIKKTAFHALDRAKSLGLELKILSGDSKEACAAVGIQLGLISQESAVVLGADFAAQSPQNKKKTVKESVIFARVSPEHKCEIIRILQEEKDVAYLGDGINDVLALKEAHVGLAVNDATDVAREAADIILLRKSLTVIIDGIQEGRRVFANTLKYIKFNLAANFGNFYSLGVAALFIDQLPMLPAQILLVNFLSDIPLIALATDTVPEDELKRPARYDIKNMLILTTILGIVSSVFDLVYFAFFFHLPFGIVQTGWFVLNVLTEVIFIFSIRTNKFFMHGSWPSRSLWISTIFAAGFGVWVVYTALGQRLFNFSYLDHTLIVKIILITLAYFVVSEIVKLLYYKVNSGRVTPIK